jgi:hypothetical protein
VLRSIWVLWVHIPQQESCQGNVRFFVGKIAKFTEFVVPIMAIIYIVIVLVIIVIDIFLELSLFLKCF